jgi:rhodanese-related sulfurtransferase
MLLEMMMGLSKGAGGFCILFLLLACLGLGLACRQAIAWPTIKSKVRRTFPEVRQLTTGELADRLAKEEAVPLLIDARGAEEYAVSHLPGAHWVDPDAQGSELLAALPEGLAKDAPIVAYCSVGYRSSALARRLMAAGYSNVHNLEGSIFQWANEGRVVVHRDVVGDPGAEVGQERAVRQVHPYDPTWGRLLHPELHAYGGDT